MQWFKTILLASSIATVSVATQAKQTLCVFDLVGRNGDVYALMKDYQIAAKSWGADIELRVGQNEAVLAESGNSSNQKKYRDKLHSPMAGHAFG